jgi:hypothetical protein
MSGFDANDQALGRADGDGAVGPEEMGEIRRKILQWNDRAQSFFDKRVEGLKARHCLWRGQGPDGRLWADNNDGETPTPFNGASDQRIRWADGIVLDKSAVLMTGLAAADISVKAVGAKAGSLAGNLTVMLLWMIKNMGAEWYRQWKILASYYLGDSPAAAMMSAEWVREERMEYKTLTGEDLVEMYAAARTAGAQREGIAPTAALDDSVTRLRLLLEEGEGDRSEAEGMIAAAFGIKPAAAARVVRELIKDGESEFPVRVYGDEGPVLKAWRMGEDFIIPDNATDFERCGMWFRTEWLTRSELEAKETEEKWDAAFIEATLSGGNGLAVVEDAVGRATDCDRKKDLWQVVYVYHTAVNGDGVKAKYVTVVSHAKDVTAFGRQLIRGTRGKWPAKYFQRDVMNKFLIDSRGIPELVGPHQGAAKKLRDVCTDNGIISGLPPWFAKGTNAQRNSYMSPLKRIDLRINENIGFMTPPQVPETALKIYGEIAEEVRDYMGEPRPEGPEQAPGLRRREEAQWFMAQAYDVLRMMVELAQDNASDDWLASVTDEGRGVNGLRRDQVLGRFRVQVAFNADDLDPTAVIEKAKAVGMILAPMDSDKIINKRPIIETTMRSLYPNMPDDALITEAQAGSREIMDEAKNLSMIRAGAMPEMDTEGNWNYAARLQWYQQLKEQNPAVFDDMAQDKRAMLEQWLTAMAQQATQFGENRAIGRTGTEGVESE